MQTQSPARIISVVRFTVHLSFYLSLLFLIGLSAWTTLHELVLYQLTKSYLTALDPALYSPFEWSISLSGPWLWGLILLALAQVYLRGYALEEEVELTV